MQPLVSIVIPCYNGALYLPAAIESCLSQTYGNIEIIVVDDCSPDNCAQIAADYSRKDSRLRLISHKKNGGVARAFNTGFNSAKGDFMTRLAQDDFFERNAIEEMVRFLQRHSEIGLVYCDMNLVDANGKVIAVKKAPEPDKIFAKGHNKVGLCVMWRRTVWEQTGGFNPQWDAAEDYDFWLRAAKRFKFGHYSDSVPFAFRSHEQMGSKVFAVKQEIAHARLFAEHGNDWWSARKLLGSSYFNVGYIYRTQKKYLLSVQHLLKSFVFWPFQIKAPKCFVGLILDTLRSR
ncbi:MAG: glycosyl transferase [Verrucomicrobiales bacterium]|nr:glycosyl transferase [Verrucomicrobiales bacterium]